MERKVFLRNSIGFLGLALSAPELFRTGKPAGEAPLSPLDCTIAASETAGPFPTINPANYNQSNIIGDRTGVNFTVNIYIKNKNANCSAYQGALVDIWHCDKDGNYSQYGGTGMQPTNYTAYNFLRGRQVSDANGLVSFTSIFPGWYTGRATHIHVHIYNAAGTSLLVTQIAFPEGTASAVATVNAATAYGYTKGMTGYTYNASDNVFSDGVSTELASVSGALATGYTLDHTIYVNGPTLGVEEVEPTAGTIGQNYPNPMDEYTLIPVSLPNGGDLELRIFDLAGRQIGAVKRFSFGAGASVMAVNRSEYGFSSGYYIYTVNVDSGSGAFTRSGKMLVK
ncbi:MAG TPA: T9SS type A sorting domain-containing protein [Flavobacterium sp.]|nr:T9SS type A sorting domain-containing protein [Flavobacterium sp.]